MTFSRSIPRQLIPALVIFALGLAVPSSARAQTRYPLKVKNVHIGLPPGPFWKGRDDNNQPSHIFKAAMWAPVWVELECTENIDDHAIEISVDTPDGDDVISSARIVVPAPRKGVVAPYALGRLPYLKPGGIVSQVTVNVRLPNGRQLADSFSAQTVGLPPSRYLLLSVGSPLPGLRLPKTEQTTEESPENDPLRGGWVDLAQITRVDELPDQWFGYGAVDLMLLTTGGDRNFFNSLANDARRRAALREWVRRGGRLVISAGANADLFDALPELKEMLPAKLPAGGKSFVDLIAMNLGTGSQRLLLQPAAGGKLALQAFEAIPEHPYQEKLVNDDVDNRAPLVVQASYGLGRVTLVAFDLDVGPVVDWRSREEFWQWLINASGTRLPKGTDQLNADARNDDGEDKYLSRIQNNLEFFEGVPVISFGWVALFILFYILLIGPIEYLILKRLFKRLEWTWITFPIIVATVSAAAYFTAYELKGRDLKVNKIDLVDIDLRGNRAYGDTWFTIFSPRIENYTIGVEPLGPRADDPSKPAWVPDGLDKTLPETLVTWEGKAKSNRQSLFRRTYWYHPTGEPDASGNQPFADGLEQVPIQVWSTKSFTASWSARIDPAKPLFTSTLRISEADPSQITGSITSHLPVGTLSDAQLFYRDRVTPLPALPRGAERFVSTSPQAATATSWLQSANTHKDLLPSRSSRGSYRYDSEDDPTFRLWPVLFHDLTQGQNGWMFNSSLRDLDQSWRVAEKSRHEAILIARVGRKEGPAEEMSNSAGSPTRLWLSEIPGSAPRTPLKGTLRQETYIRVFIPVRK